MTNRDFLVAGGTELERKYFEGSDCRTLKLGDLTPAQAEHKCRVLMLIGATAEDIERIDSYWTHGFAPAKLLATSDPDMEYKDYLVFNRAQIMKPTFQTLVMGLLNNQRDKEAHDVLARVSHDMRSPISVIKMACQLTQANGQCEVSREKYLSMILDGTREIQTLVGDILDFSKLDHGIVSLTETTFDLHQLFGNVVEGSRLLAEDKGLELHSSVHKSTPRLVRGDPGRLRQILTNLVNNAIKFTPQGSIELHTVPFRGGCGFEVIDTGMGIPAEAQVKIFDAYQQADDTILNRFGGTGLGLSICQMLVKRMGGELTVWSTPGEGSCFSFSVKLAEVIEQQQAIPALQSDKIKIWTLDHTSVKDWKSQAAALNIGLEIFQKTYTLARKSTEVRPDVFIFNLDDGGFVRLARIINQITEPKMKVVVTTSAGQRGDAARCRELGVKGYLSAPFEFETLMELSRFVARDKGDDLVTRHTLKEQGQVKVENMAS